MKKGLHGYTLAAVILAAALLLGQGLSFVLAPQSWMAFWSTLPRVLSMIAFWGPIIAILAGAGVWGTMKLMGFNSIEEIRQESVEQNNPTPAILFTGVLIACILLLMLVIRP